MPLLLLVSFIWAFSPGLIKGRLVGVDGGVIAAARLGLALLVFLPFLRFQGMTVRTALAFAVIGAVQFGIMYLAYNASFLHLQSYEVALFTLTTPIFVTLLADALDRTLRARALLAALVAVAGAATVTIKSASPYGTLAGITLVQLSNAAFAVGQVFYRRVRARHAALRDRDVFGLLYAGAFVVTLPVALAHTGFSGFGLNSSQALTLLYLGVLSSGIGFFLWNIGATQVSGSMLAVMNNVKIPLMVACSLLFFHESASLPRLFAGGALMLLAVWLAGRRTRHRPLLRPAPFEPGWLRGNPLPHKAPGKWPTINPFASSEVQGPRLRARSRLGTTPWPHWDMVEAPLSHLAPAMTHPARSVTLFRRCVTQVG
jgi:drug/metabolite transporter (DMT)-like permease